MDKERFRMNSDNFFLIIATVLTGFIFLIYFFSKFVNFRNTLTILQIGMMNFIFFLSISILFKRSEKLKFVSLFASVLYLLFQIASILIFFVTGHALGIHFALFIYKINLFRNFLIGVLAVLLVVTGISLFVNSKLFRIKKRKFSFKISIFILLVFFLLLFGYNLFSVEERIVRERANRDNLVFAGECPSEKILNITLSGNPNLIFILLESIGAEKIYPSEYSRRGNETIAPILNDLYSRGIVFENAYSISSHSDYSQPGVLSSSYLLVNNYRNFFNSPQNNNSIWEILSEQNYSTYYISSQNERWAGMSNHLDYSTLDFYWDSETDGVTDYGFGLERNDYDHKTTDVALEKLKEHLQREDDSEKNPFFLYMNFQSTHEPYGVPPEKIHVFENKDILAGLRGKEFTNADKYDGALRYVDNQIGRILEFIEENNQTNNTIFIISSDHAHDLYSRHDLYGHGLSLYEEEVRVPLIFLIPGQENRLVTQKVSHIDLVPTIVDILNLSQKEGFRGRPFEEGRRIFFTSQSHNYLVGMIEGNTKIIVDLNRKSVEVYNLLKDPLELDNLFKQGENSVQVKTLLTWHNCQINYFSKESPLEELEPYCEPFRN